ILIASFQRRCDMMLHNRQVFSAQRRTCRATTRPRRRVLSLEILEDRLALSSDPLVFAIVGDYGTASSILNVPNLLLGVPDTEGDVARLIHSWNPEFLLTAGDNNYLCGEQFDRNLILQLELAIGTGELSAATAQTIMSGLAEIPVLVTTSVKGDLTLG